VRHQEDEGTSMRIIQIISMLNMFRKDTRGATAIEYGLIAAGIAVAIAAAVFALGTDLEAIFGNVADSLEAPTGDDG